MIICCNPFKGTTFVSGCTTIFFRCLDMYSLSKIVFDLQIIFIYSHIHLKCDYCNPVLSFCSQGLFLQRFLTTFPIKSSVAAPAPFSTKSETICTGKGKAVSSPRTLVFLKTVLFPVLPIAGGRTGKRTVFKKISNFS